MCSRLWLQVRTSFARAGSGALLSKSISATRNEFFPDVYIQGYKKDARWLKCLVGLIFIWESVQTLLLTHDMFHILIYGWGNPNSGIAVFPVVPRCRHACHQ